MLKGCSLLAIFAVCGLLLSAVSGQSSQANFDDLRRELLRNRNYDSGSPPYHEGVLQVEFELVLTTLIEVSTAAEFIEFESWWRLYWKDPRLSWNPDEFGGLSQMVLSHTEVWTPDVVYFEKLSDSASFYGTQVTASGDVLWSTPRITKIGCPMNIRAFPYDTQTCNFTIGSWTYNGVQLDLAPRRKDISGQVPEGEEVPPRSALDLQQYTQVEPWTLEVARVLWKDTYYGCCVEPYPVLIFEFQLERASRTHFSGVITPMLLVSFIGFCIFLIPAPLSGARPALSTTMLLTYVTVYFVASRSTPQSNKTTSIGRMYVVGIIFAGAQVILSIISTGLNLVTPDTGKGGEKWMAVFNKFDKDSDGILNQQELNNACKSLGVTAEEKREILEMLDQPEDGVINAEQWKGLGEITKKADDRATYHNHVVEGLVKRALKKQLRQHKPSSLTRLHDNDGGAPIVNGQANGQSNGQANGNGNAMAGSRDLSVSTATSPPVDQKQYHLMPVYQSGQPYASSLGQMPPPMPMGVSPAPMAHFIHGVGFGQNRDEEMQEITALDLQNRSHALHNHSLMHQSGLASLAEKLEDFTKTTANPARTGRSISAYIDSWALWIMLPAYICYLIAEFGGAWSGYTVKGYEVGFGEPPVKDQVLMEFYDYRTNGEFKCYKYTPKFEGTVGLMDQARRDCKEQENSRRMMFQK